MILLINTGQNDIIRLGLEKNGKAVIGAEVAAKYAQAELLLPTIDKMLGKAGVKLREITGINVASKGEGFTALRIGVLTANALGYALNIPVNGGKPGESIVHPLYNREPNIKL